VVLRGTPDAPAVEEGMMVNSILEFHLEGDV